MKDVARGISDMSVVLYELRRILRKHGGLFKRRLLSRLDSAAKRVRAVHGEVRSMIRRSDAVVARVLWVFRQVKVLQLLSMIEGIIISPVLVLCFKRWCWQYISERFQGVLSFHSGS